MPVLGVDVSFYDHVVDWKLLKENGVEFAICKATQGDYTVDPKFEEHVDGAGAAGILPGAYHWNDPVVNDLRAAELFLEVTAKQPVRYFMNDMEQYWANWAEYRAKAVKTFLTPERISTSAETILKYWREQAPQPCICYTRTSFVNEYAKPALAWLLGYKTCLAQYPYARGRVTLVSWSDIPFPKTKPTLPAGVARFDFWQFSGDKFILPGIKDKNGKGFPADLIWWNGTLKELQDWVMPSDTEQTPADPITFVVSMPRLNVRSGPGIQYGAVGRLVAGQKVTVKNVSGQDAWIEIEPGRWVCVSRLGNDYLTKEQKA